MNGDEVQKDQDKKSAMYKISKLVEKNIETPVSYLVSLRAGFGHHGSGSRRLERIIQTIARRSPVYWTSGL